MKALLALAFVLAAPIPSTVSIPKGIAPARPQSIPEGIAPARPQSIPEGIAPPRPQSIPEGIAPARPQSIREGIAPARPQSIPDGIAPADPKTLQLAKDLFEKLKIGTLSEEDNQLLATNVLLSKAVDDLLEAYMASITGSTF